MNNCLHCSSLAVSQFDNQYYSLNDLIYAIHEASYLGLESLAISGGEPFLSPFFDTILRETIARKIDNILIYTSGVVRDRDGTPTPLSKSTLNTLKIEGIRLIFGVHSTDPTIHDNFVGTSGRYEICIESIQKALESNIPVECHVVPSHHNISTLGSTARELIQIGVQRVSFLRLVLQGNAAKNQNLLTLNEDDEAKMASIFTNLLNENGGREKYRFGIPMSNYCGRFSSCNAGISKLIMRWDGTFLPCEAFKECRQSEFVLGKLGDSRIYQMLEEANRSSALRKLKANSHRIDPCPAQYLYI